MSSVKSIGFVLPALRPCDGCGNVHDIADLRLASDSDVILRLCGTCQNTRQTMRLTASEFCVLRDELLEDARKRSDEWRIRQARAEAEQQWQAEYRARKRLARLLGHIAWFACVFLPAAVIAQAFPAAKGHIALLGGGDALTSGGQADEA